MSLVHTHSKRPLLMASPSRRPQSPSLQSLARSFAAAIPPHPTPPLRWLAARCLWCNQSSSLCHRFCHFFFCLFVLVVFSSSRRTHCLQFASFFLPRSCLPSPRRQKKRRKKRQASFPSQARGSIRSGGSSLQQAEGIKQGNRSASAKAQKGWVSTKVGGHGERGKEGKGKKRVSRP